MSSSSGLAPRRRTAYAAKQAAKQRRQRNVAIGGLILLVIVGIFEVPGIIKRLNQSSGSSVAAPPPAAPTTTTTTSHEGLKVLPRTAPSDPFAKNSVSNSDPQVGSAIVMRWRDPFAASGSATVAPPPVTAPAQALPEKIVIGSPGGGRIAQHGWIVILASIPTGQGRSSAESFAAKASRGGIGGTSILNSSNRKPLRGGYWVVYVGPYATLAQVSARASAVHAQGYSTAYIRELIVYR